MAVQPQEDEPQPPLLSGLQLLLERPYVRVDIGIMRPTGLYRPHGMDNSAIGRHTSELQTLMRISYADFCLKKTTYKSTDEDNLIIHTQAYTHTTNTHNK